MIFIKKINIYSDGACLSNPGPGGYCAILIYKAAEKIISGGEKNTTNNRMELFAAISGLESIKDSDAENCEIDLYTDSKYVVDGIEKGWAEKWRRNNWLKSDKNPALNPELWERLLNAVKRLNGSVKFIWLKGHNGHEYNERCDEIARKNAAEYKKNNKIIINSGGKIMQNYNSIYERLLNYADNMKIIDTHEHLAPDKNYICGDKSEPPDVLRDYISHYITSDLQSAGMSGADLEKVQDFKLDVNQRFKILEPWLDCVKNTSYYRSLEIAAEKIHGIKEISSKTIEELNEKFKKAASKKDYGRHIMKDLCNIEVSINDNWSQDMKFSTTDMFAPVCQFNPDNNPAENLAFDEYCENYRRYFIKQKNDGMKSIKTTIAYWRTLYIEDVDYNAAKDLYGESMKKYIAAKKENPEAGLNMPRKLEDYMLHVLLKTADENNFVIQIHTGLQEGMRNNLENSNPMLLKNLFGKYPNLSFDIFHMGYPYERELTVLAKTHPNVYIDLCWAHIISPYASRTAFYEMLDVLPYTKIFGFGGDYIFFDGVAGHITLAKQNICTVLAQKVSGGECDIDLAEKILQSVLHDNAKRIFKL